MKMSLNIIDGEEVVNKLKPGVYNLVSAGAQLVKGSGTDEDEFIMHAQLMSSTPVEEQGAFMQRGTENDE